MNKYLAIFGLLWICFSVKAQIKTSFPAEITEKAYAVIQSNEIDFKKRAILLPFLTRKEKRPHIFCACAISLVH